jgi:hypothetical protein
LANLFAVRSRDSAAAALSAAVAFCRERPGSVAAVSTWHGLAHFAVFIAAFSVISMPVGLLPVVPGRLVLLLVIFLALVYFAVADWLYMARLAGYICILEMPEVVPALLSPQPTLPGTPPIQTTIDRDEPILSDLPLTDSH